MNARRILLIESLEAAGAAARDARTRARALLTAGCETRCAVVEPADRDALHPAPASEDTLHVRADARGRDTLLAWIDASAADAVLVASALRGGGAAGAWLDPGPQGRAWWWPSGLAPQTGPAGLAAGGPMAMAGVLPALPWATAAPGEPWAGACAGLEASVLGDARPARGHLPLWDGDYLLVPAPLSGTPGAAAIEAFAALCEGHDGLDLVVLADVQPEFDRLARAHGIGFRVHFAGPAPRDAELAWLGAASAVLIAGDAPLSGGLVLRALARGCPLIAAPGAACGPALESWLAARGLAFGAARESLVARLEQALGRDAAWAGRAGLALVPHRVESVAERLARSLAVALPARRAA